MLVLPERVEQEYNEDQYCQEEYGYGNGCSDERPQKGWSGREITSTELVQHTAHQKLGEA